MRLVAHHWTAQRGWDSPLPTQAQAQLVLVFGSGSAVSEPERYQELQQAWPGAVLSGCTTCGEILDTSVHDGSLVVVAVHFEHARVQATCADVALGDQQVGERLGAELSAPDLRHVLVFSDGLQVNGSALARGLQGAVGSDVGVTGGLAGDQDRFERTGVVADGPPREGVVCAVGLYGERLEVGYGSMGGWDPFGPERRVTRSEGNVLYELDDYSALGLYMRYLGDHAAELPGSALRFPLSVRVGEGRSCLVRTILAVDEDSQSMVFAGDLPQGSVARLMRANPERLIDGAQGAASEAAVDGVELALLVSCVGRRMVLRQRVEEELEVVREALGSSPMLTGFYSYGELCPSEAEGACELHNQTMTITTLREV